MPPKRYKKGTCVCAPRDGYSQWPVLIVRRLDVPEEQRAKFPRASAENRTVRFFGFESCFAVFPNKALSDYSPGLASRHSVMNAAYREADAYIEKRGLDFQRDALNRVLAQRTLLVNMSMRYNEHIEGITIDGTSDTEEKSTEDPKSEPKQPEPLSSAIGITASKSLLWRRDMTPVPPVRENSSSTRLPASKSPRVGPSKQLASHQKSSPAIQASIPDRRVQDEYPEKGTTSGKFATQTHSYSTLPQTLATASPSPAASTPTSEAPEQSTVPLLVPIGAKKRRRPASSVWRAFSGVDNGSSDDERDMAAFGRIFSKAARLAEELASRKASVACLHREEIELRQRKKVHEDRIEKLKILHETRINEMEKYQQRFQAELEALEETCRRLRADKAGLDVEVREVGHEKRKVENEKKTLEGVNRGLRRENRTMEEQQRALKIKNDILNGRSAEP